MHKVINLTYLTYVIVPNICACNTNILIALSVHLSVEVLKFEVQSVGFQNLDRQTRFFFFFFFTSHFLGGAQG
jgi:hypothetical protein